MRKRLQTQLVQHETAGPDCSGAASTPIYQTATFDIDNPAGLDYSRSGNPTRSVLEEQLCSLDGGTRSLAYSSGIAAVDAVLSLVPHGCEIAVADDLYGGTQRLLDIHQKQRGIKVSFFKTGDIHSLSSTIGPDTKLVLIELPSNPYLKWTDIAASALVCGARGVPLAVDYSMLSPLLIRPLDEGADIAVQSATKFLGGHSDLTAGVVSVKDEAIAEELYYNQNARGTAAGPFECWLLLRGIKTLDVRLQRQIENTEKVVDYLARRSEIDCIYTSRTEDASNPLCPVFSISLAESSGVEQVLKSTRLFRTSVSFGGVSSSISAPSSMSHACVQHLNGAYKRIEANLIRLSIGIESAADLIADLGAALTASSYSLSSAAAIEV